MNTVLGLNGVPCLQHGCKLLLALFVHGMLKFVSLALANACRVLPGVEPHINPVDKLLLIQHQQLLVKPWAPLSAHKV